MISYLLNTNKMPSINHVFRKHFSETEIEILISKYDVDGNTLFTLNEITALQDGSDPTELESDEG